MASHAKFADVQRPDSYRSVQGLIANLEQLNSSIVDSLAELRKLEKCLCNPGLEKSNGAPIDQRCSNGVKARPGTLNTLRAQLVDSAERITLLDQALLAYGSESRIDDSRKNINEKRQAVRLPLDNEEYERYGRQLIMPEIGAKGQLRLKNASVLIIGLGGLGCPAAAYLAAAGVGTLGLVDGDSVDLSNLHRQILHSTETVGTYKVNSAIHSLKRINPRLKYMTYNSHISSENILSICAQYDLVLDCTDHPTSRYLISDAAVLCSKPLVSAAALRTDGQLMVLNNPPAPQGHSTGGPCYRCVFPTPPPPESVTSCGEGGILGPVVGAMGVLQALEALKILTQSKDTTPVEPSLLMYSAFNNQPFRTVKLRGRKTGCPACSDQATISRESLLSGSLDYVQFCGAVEPVNILKSDERISTKEYSEELRNSAGAVPATLVDVREKTQFELCSFPGSINIPYADIMSWKSVTDADSRLVDFEKKDQQVTLVCRFGNDSQLAVRKFEELGLWTEKQYLLRDIKGGWKSWKQNVDPDWPDY